MASSCQIAAVSARMRCDSNHTVALAPCDQGDLGLIARTNPGAVAAGNRAKLALTVQNYGDDPAGDTVLTLTLPAGVTTTTPSACTKNGRQLTCRFGSIPAGKATHLSLQITVSPATPAGTRLTFPATATAVLLVLAPDDRDPHTG